jgi:hypothetical protein
MAQKGWTEKRCENRIFLNTVEGRPLSSKGITQIFSRALAAIGAPKGAGMHSLRRKFTDDETDIEIAVRTRENRSTDPINIAFAMSRKLGQSTLEAQESYNKSIGRTTWKTLERRQNDRINLLEMKLADEKLANAHLSNFVKICMLVLSTNLPR